MPLIARSIPRRWSDAFSIRAIAASPLSLRFAPRRLASVDVVRDPAQHLETVFPQIALGANQRPTGFARDPIGGLDRVADELRRLGQLAALAFGGRRRRPYHVSIGEHLGGSALDKPVRVGHLGRTRGMALRGGIGQRDAGIEVRGARAAHEGGEVDRIGKDAECAESQARHAAQPQRAIGAQVARDDRRSGKAETAEQDRVLVILEDMAAAIE